MPCLTLLHFLCLSLALPSCVARRPAIPVAMVLLTGERENAAELVRDNESLQTKMEQVSEPA